MTISPLQTFVRLPHTRLPIYIDPKAPHWFIPSTSGDRLLTRILKGEEAAPKRGALEALRQTQFLSLIPTGEAPPYGGRDEVLSLKRLTECWIHITNHCNLACSHCLFSCSPTTRSSLSFEAIEGIHRETQKLGTEIYYLTGGEPLMHPDFRKICTRLLSGEKTRLVILTNGLLLSQQMDFFKTLPKERLHLQISVDGLEAPHDAIRGTGNFQRLCTTLDGTSSTPLNIALAMAVHPNNSHQMGEIVHLAHRFGISNVHYLWLFAAGKACQAPPVPVDELFAGLIDAEKIATPLGIAIDNIKSMEARVFASPGIRHDLGNAGWDSLAVGPDGTLYPTPALIGQEPAACGHLSQGVERTWQESPQFKAVRSLSLIHDETWSHHPLRFIVGGGDIDHSFHARDLFMGADPYIRLYEKIAIHLMEKSAEGVADSLTTPLMRIQMGDRVSECHHAEGDVALTHSNCVLSLSGTHGTVGAFYSEAAETPNKDILNPVCYDEALISHIPEEARVRSYGCGSPVQDAALQEGETLVDLGSGTGVECFIAARITGERGRVYGIDMLETMLSRANRAKETVEDHLGYKNITFKKGFLESLPLKEETAHAVISNCVVNLSEDKTQTFAEIFRILKPGGRAVISDVTCDAPFPAAIQNDPTLRGECIGGAMVQPRLMAMLEATGFTHIQIIKRFFYREVQGHRFHSLTYRAIKPDERRATLLYPGPFAGVITDQGEIIPRGHIAEVTWPKVLEKEPSAPVTDALGTLIHQEAENGCACYLPPEEASPPLKETTATILSTGKKSAGCMRCGSPLTYLEREREETCAFCGERIMANATCERGHFVCDICHSKDALAVVKHLCLTTKEADTITLFDRIKKHPAVPLHGPEHHFIVPGVITAAYRNAGGTLGDAEILSAIRRGADIPGGSCAFWGGCGAALGTGIAFGIILQSTPLKPRERRIVQQVVGRIIHALGEIEAARCCRRETLTALQIAADLSKEILPVPLRAEGPTHCLQFKANKECITSRCPWYVAKGEIRTTGATMR